MLFEFVFLLRERDDADAVLLLGGLAQLGFRTRFLVFWSYTPFLHVHGFLHAERFFFAHNDFGVVPVLLLGGLAQLGFRTRFLEFGSYTPFLQVHGFLHDNLFFLEHFDVIFLSSPFFLWSNMIKVYTSATS